MRRKAAFITIILAAIVFAWFTPVASAGYRRAVRSCGISRAEFRVSNPKPLGNHLRHYRGCSTGPNTVP